MSEIEISDVSPMMQHYLLKKEEYKDCILFYRLGDFYEMFFKDAEIVSKELELTLTGKSCGLEERAPMCGVPFHAAETYITRLVNRGYKVAICEQLEDPKLAKGIVKRDVIRVVTPGTIMDTVSLDETKNNFLMSVSFLSDRYGISITDISTGDFFATEEASLRGFLNEFQKYMPSEIICNEAFLISGAPVDEFRNHYHIPVTALDSYYFDEEQAFENLTNHFHVTSLSSLDLDDFPVAALSAGAMLQYLRETQKNELSTLTEIKIYRNSNFMILDSATRRNLELVETLREKEKRGSLLWVLDKTKTAMGARCLRQNIEQPLRDVDEINARYEAIDELLNSLADREEIREYLSAVYDLERLLTRISYRTANPRDLVAFRNSILVLNGMKGVLSQMKSSLLHKIYEELDPLLDLCRILESSIQDEPPVSTHEGGIFKENFSEEIDELRIAKTDGKKWISELEIKEREKTGIKNLKIKYNKVFGYFLEVTNSFKDLAPDYFIRKQTLANAERYYTEELKEMENKILGAEDRLNHLENELFNQILNQICEEIDRIHKTAKAVANLDFLQSLSVVAEKQHYVKPYICTDGHIDIKHGRHPVVEKMLGSGSFIDNDTYLDKENHRVDIITGPNMAGKSTYMRQVALITLMAQIGSFVPAESAEISIADRIFTRVGASDDLSSGQSTFMVEMNEVANILKNATSDSLLILDEIGRGTSTFDGLSIAWAVVEYISNPRIIGAKTLFATHYHELTELEGKLSGVHNYCSAVRENDDGIVFLRKIVKGGADRSYGIEVAKLAGLPEDVISRAKDLLNQLSDNDLSTVAASILPNTSNESVKTKKSKKLDDVDRNQFSLFATTSDNDIIEEIRNMDLSHMTPIDALNQLNDLQNQVNNRW